MSGQQLTFCLWETTVERAADGSVTLRPRTPLSTMSAKAAAKVLGVTQWTVGDLYRAGLLDGYKPGARVVRKDGRASNAALRLDSASVLRYKSSREEIARKERDF